MGIEAWGCLLMVPLGFAMLLFPPLIPVVLIGVWLWGKRDERKEQRDRTARRRNA